MSKQNRKSQLLQNTACSADAKFFYQFYLCGEVVRENSRKG